MKETRIGGEERESHDGLGAGDTGPSRLGHRELPQGQPRISCVFSGQCQSQWGTLLDDVGPGVTRKPHDPRSPLFWEAAPQARPTCGAAPAEPADLGVICGGRGRALVLESRLPPPSHNGPLSPISVRPHPPAPQGTRERPLHHEGNQCSVNVLFPGGWRGAS